MKNTLIGAMTTALALGATAALADENADLTVNGETEITLRAPAPDHLSDVLDEVRSGWTFRSSETQQLQMDDFDNPGMIFVDQAEERFAAVDGSEGKACKDCHADVAEFKGLRTQLPKLEDGKLASMEDLINECRTDRMGAEKWKWGGAPMQSMVALIGLQSRGMPMNVKIDGDYAPFWEKGKEMYYTRYGQLELSCANCHEDNYDNMIRADHLSQGQINGFPTYRLKNTKLNSMHDRFKGCIRDTRAETFSPGSDEFRALELYVSSRGNGLSVETPSVRN